MIIASPNDTHARLIEEASKAGKHIFCEKPLALDLPSADVALAAVGKSGVKLQVGFQRRFDPGKTRRVVRAMRDVPGIVEMHEVMGPYDVVLEIEVDKLQDIPPILGEKIRGIEGIESTTSLVTLPD